MSNKIIEKLKNQQGSSLAFVLIIGMIIMIMVASLLAVANSDFAFTQETVESRQAYIDAKSVIEFGKIEINSREKELSTAYQALVAAENDKKSTAATIDRIKNDIAALESKVTTIYGNETNPSGSLSFSDDGTKTVIGKVLIEKNESAVNTTNTSQYIFKVETENLRRKLDYQVDYNYVTTTGGTGSGTGTGSPSVPDPQIIVNNLNNLQNNLMTRPDMSGWKTTKIKIESWSQTPKTKCTIGEPIEKTYQSQNNTQINNDMLTVSESALSLKIDEFTWPNSPSLNLSAKNICFNAYPSNSDGESTFNITAVRNATEPSEIRFTQNYLQTNRNNKTNSLKADHVIFEGNLTIANNSILDIECDTLVVKGRIEVGQNSKLIINANNMIVDDKDNTNASNDGIVVESAGKVSVDCKNVLIKGNLNPKASSVIFEFININYFQADDINLSSGCQLTVMGADMNNSQMNVKSIIPYQSNAYKLNISNLWSFTCTGLSLNFDSSLNLNSNIVLINGDFTLGPQASEPLLIKTQYFDCSGMTTFDHLQGNLYIRRIAAEKPLDVRFKGGYQQTASWNSKGVIIGEVNNNATMIVFGSPESTINIPEDRVYLDLMADNIYFDSNDIYVMENKNFTYSNGKATNNNKTNFFIRSDVKDVNQRNNKVVDAGSYYSVKGYFPQMLNDNKPPGYVIPTFPNPPGSGGSSSVVITQGAEKYY